MKIFQVILFIFFALNFLYAKSDKFSSIPLPQGYFFDLESKECDIICVQELLDNQLVFSFLTYYDDEKTTKTLQENYIIYGQIFNVFLADINTGNIRFAILVPQKTIKSYALNSINSAISYLLKQSNEFEIVVYNSGDESNESLNSALTQIRQDGFIYILAPVTQSGADFLIQNSDGLNIYIPTLHSSIFSHVPYNVIFGGIDYDSQIKALDKFSNEFVVTYYDNSKLSQNLDATIKEQDVIVLEQTSFDKVKQSYKNYFENNKNLNSSTVYFNTPLVTTSLLASQIRAYKHKPFSMLSTQINYSPMFLSLTQPEDRIYFFIANSIGEIDDELNSINSILGQKIEYDWVNYSTSIGVEFISAKFLPNIDRLFKEDIVDSMVIYNTNVYRTGKSKFIKQDDDYDFFSERIESFPLDDQRNKMIEDSNTTKRETKENYELREEIDEDIIIEHEDAKQ